MSSEDDSRWTHSELKATAKAYLEMQRLAAESKPFTKADFNRRLRSGPLSGRTESAVEFRMQNISAVLDSMGRPWLGGYRPAANVGPTNEARLRTIIAELEEDPKPKTHLVDICPSPESLMGVKAVFGELSSHVLCFGSRGSINESRHFTVAASAAQRAIERPYVITIGAGENVRSGLDGRVLNLARVSMAYGPTNLFMSDPDEAARLAQWPVAVVLLDAWTFVGLPNLVEDLGMPDRKVLAGVQDGIIRPKGKFEMLWERLKDWPMELTPLSLPANFYAPRKPTLLGSIRPTNPGATEGERILKEQERIERDPRLSKAAKALNVEKFGQPTCESCLFTNSDSGLFDAHHPTPLAIGVRKTLPEHLEILCPICHRKAHRKNPLDPLTLIELQAWVTAGRP